MGDGARLAAEAWDLPALRDAYDQFLADCDAEPASPVEGLTTLVHRWRRFPFLEPDLPHDVLAPDWPAQRAAMRFAHLRNELQPEAMQWWADHQRDLGLA